MKKLILIAVLLLTTSQTTFAQQAIAKIKFEEAEEAYAAENYKTTISKLDEVVSILKNTNPKVMYLRIMAQSKIIEGNPSNDFKIIDDTRKLCAKYLKNYENIPDNEDKYRDIYKVSEILKSYPANEVDFNSEKQNRENGVIGTQTWAKTNLDVDHYRNGDPIPHVTDLNQWRDLTTGAWCYYDNDSANGATYGKLYNWYAVNDPRGLAPAGWHVPSNSELKTLVNYLGGKEVAGCKMKATTGWKISPNKEEKTTNSTGFTALPGGYLFGLAPSFIGIAVEGNWWISRGSYNMTYIDGYVFSGEKSSYDGLSVRCIKD